MMVHSSTQHPTEIQHKVAEALGLPMDAVVWWCAGWAAASAARRPRATRSPSPARWRPRRPAGLQDALRPRRRHASPASATISASTTSVGFDAEGRILALDVTHSSRCGWSMDLSLPVADRAMFHADNAYLHPGHADHLAPAEDQHQPNTAFRGFGGPQGMVGIERIVETSPATWGWTRSRCGGATSTPPPRPPRNSDRRPALGGACPGRIRRRRRRRSDNTTPYRMAVTDFIIHELIDGAARASSDYRARRAAMAACNARRPILKKGIALTPVKFGISFTLTHLNQAGALVHVYRDGSIQLNHGGTEMGQGLHIKVAQVAAEAFGVPLDRVRITATNTAQGAQHLGHRRLLGHRPQRHGGAERAAEDQGPARRRWPRALRGDARPRSTSRGGIRAGRQRGVRPGTRRVGLRPRTASRSPRPASTRRPRSLGPRQRPRPAVLLLRLRRRGDRGRRSTR